MKIDMLESLGSSFLRHVHGCWLVQTNWKASVEGLSNETWHALEDKFAKAQTFVKQQTPYEMEEVFKGNSSVHQLLKQAEIDAVGVTADGTVHALEAAFHERGLEGAQCARILKKMLRTLLVLDALATFAEGRQIWFVSPKVTRKPAQQLEDMFTKLCGAYPEVNWHLRIGPTFLDKVLKPTLKAASSTSDTSELFVRAERLRCASGLEPVE